MNRQDARDSRTRTPPLLSWRLGALAVLSLVAGAAAAQTVDVARPKTIVVGAPAGGSRTDRVDAARTGLARTALPATQLRTEWHASTTAILERAPIVNSAGETFVVGTRGEVVAIARDGSEKWRASTSAMQPGPATLASDGSVVFVDSAGEAVAVRDGAVRWRTRFGRDNAARPAPIALDDGGVVAATSYELCVLDGEGHERARTTLPEPTFVPLVSALGRVVAIGASGAVWTWVPGAPETTRVASFGSPVDGGAALADDHTLVAVTAGQLHVTAVDLVRGSATTRAVSPASLWLGPPAMRGGEAHLLVLAPTSEQTVTLGPRGDEIARATILPRAAPAAPDGGAASLVSGPHTPPIVDAAGTLAFASLDGAIGVATGGTVDLLPDACPSSSAGAGRALAVVGLAPLGPDSFVAACRSGTVIAVRAAASSGGDRSPHL